MADFDILFQPFLAQAIWDGRKTMTRRIAWNQVKDGSLKSRDVIRYSLDTDVVVYHRRSTRWQKPQPGDRLWVREAHWRWGRWRHKSVGYKFEPIAATMGNVSFGETAPGNVGQYGDPEPAWHHRPGIFLPKDLSRMTLVVTETKVEPLHAITRADVLAEGLPLKAIKAWEQWLHPNDAPGQAFGMLWDQIHGKGEWNTNPEVVALSFRVERQNIIQMARAA